MSRVREREFVCREIERKSVYVKKELERECVCREIEGGGCVCRETEAECVCRKIDSVYVEKERERERDGRGTGTVRVWPRIMVTG